MLLVILVFCSCDNIADAPTAASVSKRNLPTPPAHISEKLNSLKMRCSELGDKFDYETLERSASEYLELVSRYNEPGHVAYANFVSGVAKMMYRNSVECEPLFYKAYEQASYAGIDSICILSLNSLGICEGFLKGNFSVAQKYLLRALEWCERIGRQRSMITIYNNLAEVGAEQGDTTSMRYAMLALQMRENHTTHHQSSIFLKLAKHYGLRKEYGKALSYASMSRRVSQESRFSRQRLYTIDIVTAGIYNDMGQYKKALDLLDSIFAIQGENPLSPDVKIDALYQKARALSLSGKDRQALADCTAAIHTAHSSHLHFRDMGLLRLMAEINWDLGDYDRSRELYRQIIDVTSRMKADTEDYLVRERNMQLKIVENQRQRDIARLSLESRTRMLILISIATILLAIFIVLLMYHIRRRNRLHLHIVTQYKESIENESRLQHKVADLENTLTAHRSEDRIRKTSLTDENSRQIYNELLSKMESLRLYADPQLNRETLAELLSTNRTYLTSIIKEHSGMSLPQFINSFRIRKAIEMLSSVKSDQIADILKDLWQQVGFLSQPTFRRAFREYVGMNPSEYAKTAGKIN